MNISRICNFSRVKSVNTFVNDWSKIQIQIWEGTYLISMYILETLDIKEYSRFDVVENQTFPFYRSRGGLKRHKSKLHWPNLKSWRVLKSLSVKNDGMPSECNKGESIAHLFSSVSKSS